VLKELSLKLHVPSGKSYRVPLHLNAKEIQLVAYLAWLDAQSRGQTISLGKLREHIFGYGRADEDATPEKLGGTDGVLGRKRATIGRLAAAITPIFASAGFMRCHSYCRKIEPKPAGGLGSSDVHMISFFSPACFFQSLLGMYLPQLDLTVSL
jgi:hypothetical protein